MVSLIHERTEGYPLFMVDMLRDLHQRGILRRSALGWELKGPIARIAREVPSSVQGMIEHKIQLMHEHQALLHLAAVQGYEFDSGYAHAKCHGIGALGCLESRSAR
ncbi:MAG: hypothetical protein DMG39_00220 [Acidobacteria bacterium]|nr:MAG: hypothetical protein DMG39_00220 [Acidobacteriota bacterium]